MEKTKKVEFEVGGMKMHFETGLLAQQAAGAVTCHAGDDVLFSAVSSASEPREGVDFFPLQVEYKEKFYAAGRFPGGFFKREARPSEKEVLTMRVTDRPVRSLFPDGFYNEVQINNLLLSCDAKREADVLSINASSAALTISELPFQGPIGGVRVGWVDGEVVINPTHETLEKSELDLMYVGTRELPLMIEGNACELSEDNFIRAMKAAHAEVLKIIDAQLELRKELGLPDKKIELPVKDETLLDKLRELGADNLEKFLEIKDKGEREAAIKEFKNKLQEEVQAQDEEITDDDFFHAFDDLESEKVRQNVIQHKKRIGGRGLSELRELDSQVGLLPRAHGSAVFQRGETQALAVATLAAKKESQSLDAVTGGASEKRFFLHYNFPPYCVGETGRLGRTSRREQGHGNLAERSLLPMIPKDYPYAVRVVSEVMGSNGSSSMATICAGSLALMDAGVKIKNTVAGISVGLFTGDNGEEELVTDILGTEDHCGDMDFKVAGTRKGITGFQVDLKMKGLTWDLVAGALEKAREARVQIIDKMESVLPATRDEMSPYAPRIKTLKINPEKIGGLIGPGGKHIRGITDNYDVQIDIEDDGTVSLFSSDKDQMQGALDEVMALTAEVEIGKLYEGKVVTVRDFGAFVEVLPGKDGLVHISEMADYHVKKVEDICSVGDKMWVKCIDIDKLGRVRLSRRAAQEDRGETDEE